MTTKLLKTPAHPLSGPVVRWGRRMVSTKEATRILLSEGLTLSEISVLLYDDKLVNRVLNQARDDANNYRGGY